MRRAAAVCLLLVTVWPAAAGSQSAKARHVTGVRLDDRDTLFIEYSDGREVRPPRQKGQLGFSDAAVAEDRQTVGWLAHYDNQGITTYSIPLMLVIYRSGKVIRRIENGFMFGSRWFFLDGGKRVAFHTDTVHSSLAPYYELRDVGTNRIVDKWEGPLTDKSPAWTKGFARE